MYSCTSIHMPTLLWAPAPYSYPGIRIGIHPAVLPDMPTRLACTIHISSIFTKVSSESSFYDWLSKYAIRTAVLYFDAGMFLIA